VTTLIRWAKYSAVGVAGTGIQMALLALFIREAPGHYLAASLAAVEITLLHNFLWHSRYTWKDRRDGGTGFGQLVRFHLSNGAVSIAGNLILMRVLVQEAHLPVVGANLVAVVSCAGFNFLLANHWAFRPATR
jgi:putative flippase GtrA